MGMRDRLRCFAKARRDGGTQVVIPVRAEAVHDHAPRQGAGDEDSAVRRKDASEVGVRLQSRDEAVDPEGEDARRPT